METGIPISIWDSPFPYREVNEMVPRFYTVITIWKRGFAHPLEIPISIWESPFPYRELNETVPRFYMVITIWKRGLAHPLEIPISIWESPFPYREMNETVPRFYMVITIWKRGFAHPLEIPISIWGSPFPYREVNETVLRFYMVITIWKRGFTHPHMERVNPRFHMGKQMERIPISIWGSPFRNGSPFPNGDRSVTNPFPNRVHAHLGIEVKITIWECFPYGDHRFHLVITIRKWAGRLEYSHMGNPRFRIEFVSIWGSTHIHTNILNKICSKST
jgi:hypothetical protein